MFRLIEPSSGQLAKSGDMFRLIEPSSGKMANSGNMFRLTEPSSGQFTNHIEGTFSRCAQNVQIY